MIRFQSKITKGDFLKKNMISKDEFIEVLLDDSITDDDIVEKYIMFGTPYVFSENEDIYYDLKKEIKNFFSIGSTRSVVMVGSAKMGFSISPLKKFRPIQDASDIDIAIIDTVLFDDFWSSIFEYNINLIDRTEAEDEKYRRFLEYFFKGWLRPDLLPFRYVGKKEWFDFFYSISYKKYDGRKVAAAIYKNEFFLRVIINKTYIV